MRRALSVPNPISQTWVADAVASLWQQIDALCSASKISLSQPVPDQERAFRRRIEFPELNGERYRRAGIARYVLRTDVSRCFPSIYTHSIPWALIGKSLAKQNFRSRPRISSPGDDLDEAVQRAQQKQTKGIPIGPDTSWAISELVLSCVDQRIQTKFAVHAPRVMRWVDDLEFFAPTLSSAEDLLLEWERALATFELAINVDKTSIQEAPVPLMPTWTSTLAAYAAGLDIGNWTPHSIQGFFDLAFELASTNPKQSVISWAIQRFSRTFLDGDSWSALLVAAQPAVIAEATSLPYYSLMLARASQLEAVIDFDSVEATINAVIERHATLSQGVEVDWALWIALQHGLTVHRDAANAVIAMDDNTALILLRYLSEKNLLSSEPDWTDVQARAEADDALETSDWLIAYEFAVRKWVDNCRVSAHDDFKILEKRSVRFFDESKREDVPAKTVLALMTGSDGRTHIRRSLKIGHPEELDEEALEEESVDDVQDNGTTVARFNRYI